jgi:hypothetical protein
VSDTPNTNPVQIGEFVRVGRSVGVAVPLPAGWWISPDEGLDHIGVWYGQRDRDGRPRVRTVPVEYVERAAPLLQPSYRLMPESPVAEM